MEKEMLLLHVELKMKWQRTTGSAGGLNCHLVTVPFAVFVHTVGGT